MGENETAGKLPPTHCIAEVKSSELIDSKFLQAEAYIDAQCKGSYKKKLKQKLLQRLNRKKPKTVTKQQKRVIAGKQGLQVE